MANVLTIPNSGIISFDNFPYSNLSVPPLSSSARISYDNGGGINIKSLNNATTALDRFSVDGTQGRLFSVTDVLTGLLFSVNDITGLPLLEVYDTDTIIAGEFNSNALVVSGKNVTIGSKPFDTSKLAVSGNCTVTGLISTANNGNSLEWNSVYTNVQANSSIWGSGGGGGDGISLATVTDYLSTNNVILSSVQIGAQETSTTLFVRSQKVGINTETPNQALSIVGNVSSTGLFYGDGSNLTGIVAGDTVATTLVRSSSAAWNSVYSTVQPNSATWNSVYSTVQASSATWGSGGSGGDLSLYLPLSGGALTGQVTTNSIISSTNVIYASGERVITGLSTNTPPIYYISVLTQSEYDAIASPDANTLYFIKP